MCGLAARSASTGDGRRRRGDRMTVPWRPAAPRRRRRRTRPGRAGPPPAGDHRPVRAGAQPMVDSELGLTWCSTAASTTTSSCATNCGAAGYRFFSTSDTEVIVKAYHRWGTRLRRPLLRHVRLRDRRAATPASGAGRDRLGIKPLYLAQTADRLRFASIAARAAGRRRHRHLDRPGRAEPLHDVPRRGAGAADHPHGRPQAAAGHRARRRAGRPHADTVYWSPDSHRDPARAGLSEDDWQDALLDTLRTAVERRMVADVPVGVLLSGGIDSSSSSRCWPSGPARAADVQHRLRVGGRGGRRVRVLRPGRQEIRHRPPPHHDGLSRLLHAVDERSRR